MRAPKLKLPAFGVGLIIAACFAPMNSREGDLDGMPDAAVDGAAASCTSSEECGAGRICAGQAGCTTAWACMPSPACTRDLVPFCGCDGKTFSASSTCPGRPYKHTGACSGCAPQEARAVGMCDAVLGIFWDGIKCVTLSGCRCEGRDCGNGFRTEAGCEDAYRGCPRELRPDGAPCSSGTQCQSGICEGEGCGPDQARCVPRVRICTRDLVYFCGCDGMTFTGSSSCPGRPFKHRGPC